MLEDWKIRLVRIFYVEFNTVPVLGSISKNDSSVDELDFTYSMYLSIITHLKCDKLLN